MPRFHVDTLPARAYRSRMAFSTYLAVLGYVALFVGLAVLTGGAIGFGM